MSTTEAASAAITVSSTRRWLILAIVLIADVLDLLDSTITTIAAPTIARELGGGNALVQWLGASYALALGVLLVVGGRLGDRFGRRRIFLIGIVGFTAASVACGLSWSPESIIVARLLQGAFGAVLIPQGFGILGSVFSRDQIGKAFSLFGPVMGISAVGGPILAGFIIQANLFGLGWRPMFLVNLVLGAIGIVAAFALLPKDSGDRAVSIDGIGSGLLAGTMLGLLYGLIAGSTDGWNAFAIVSVMLGLVFFALFVIRQRTAAMPLIEPSLFRNRGFTSGLLVGLAYFAAIAGLVYAFSLFLQGAMHYSAFDASLGLAPISVGIIVASFAGFALIGRLGRRLIVIGLSVTLVGVGWFLVLVLAFGSAIVPAALIAPIFVIGLGMGACFGSIYDVAIGDITPSEAGSASGSLSAVQQLANAIGAAVVTTLYFQLRASSGADHAMVVALAVVGVLVALCFTLVGIMPKKAQPENH
ncbi:DHA2 family efflux MFS transporter permease subunit [Glaciihabitans sp. UYNi722]|uniref:DHA2 family efflux MFS transporter permease subunit n=1 Tax=Glaciihabitans sp. UYNi722 TaxID=3156344 RepID=UPI003392B217